MLLLASPAETSPSFVEDIDISSRLCHIACGLLQLSPGSASKTITDELQRVLNAAARLISCTSKYDGLSALLHDELHWLDIPQRVQYKPELSMGWVDPRVGLDREWVKNFCF